MSSKTLRMFMFAAVAAALGTFGTATQATFYSVDFDPPEITGHFTGNALLDVSDTCDTESCRIDLIRLLITSSGSFGPGWFSNGQLDIAPSGASFDGGLHFLSDAIPLTFPSSDFLSTESDSSASFAICAPCSLMFTPDIGDDNIFHHHGFIANLFNSSVGDNAIYIATPVPEPGTLGLLAGGIVAAWLTRRRKTTA